MPRYDWISLTTDYGRSDGFVAACHGVIARIAPAVRVIDITHSVPPADVARGAAVLAQTVAHLPPSVHVAVVDPGVGTARRGIAVEAAQGVLVGPDNGLLPAAAEALGGVRRVVGLDRPDWFAPTVSPTFHGRDVFAPVAARLALGADLADAGAAIGPETLVRLPDPVVVIGDGWLEAEVTTVDRFGNVQLAAAGEALDRLGESLWVGGVSERQRANHRRSAPRTPCRAEQGHRVSARRAATFGDAAPGGLVVYVDSAGKAAIAINGGRAVVALGVTPGDVLRLDTVAS